MGIDGTWYNELGSRMVLQRGPDGRSLTGVYHSAVGHAVEEYILSGRVDEAPEDGQSLGWVVSWQNGQFNSHSVTAWSGQFRVVNDGEEFITTTWILTREGPPEADWESTILGKDVFCRKAPTAEDIARIRALRGLSPTASQLVSATQASPHGRDDVRSSLHARARSRQA